MLHLREDDVYSLGMRIGSLFYGIGLLDLGLEMAGLGETVWQVEKEEYCRAVLARHWPEAQRYDDVKTVGRSTLAPVDLICGGFPCTGHSPAGKKTGFADPGSSLWFEYLRVVTELRPSWVVVENSGKGANRWVDTVCSGLAEQGYACLPVPLAACDVGAPHERGRVFVIASNADCDREHAQPQHAEVGWAQTASSNANGTVVRIESGGGSGTSWQGPSESQHAGWRSAEPDMVRVVSRSSRGLDRPSRRVHALGNAAVPQVVEVIGHVIRELMS